MLGGSELRSGAHQTSNANGQEIEEHKYADPLNYSSYLPYIMLSHIQSSKDLTRQFCEKHCHRLAIDIVCIGNDDMKITRSHNDSNFTVTLNLMLSLYMLIIYLLGSYQSCR